MGYIEIEAFSLDGAVSRAQFTALDEAVQAWCYGNRPGLARRSTAIDEGEGVLVVSVFGGATAPEPVVSLDDEVAAFVAAIDPSTYRRRVFQNLR